MAKIRVDMTNVEERVLVPEGDYICKVAKITLKDNQAGDGKLLVWELLIGLGENKGSKLYHNTSLKPRALFNLRNTIIACGGNVPKSIQTIDTDKYVGAIVGVTVGHEIYKNKPTAKVADLWKASKTANGWGRAATQAAQQVQEPEEEEEVIETVNGVTDDVEEIEI